MGEVIHLQFGESGNAIGTNYWSGILEICGESTQDQPTHRDLVYPASHFSNKNSCASFRSIAVDFNPSVVDFIRSSPTNTFFCPNNFVFGHDNASIDWGRAHYGQGAELVDSVLETVRQETASADSLDGFQLFYSLGDYAGACTASLTLSKLREEFPEHTQSVCASFPSEAFPLGVDEPYLSILSLHQLIENADIVQVMDVDSLSKSGSKDLKQVHRLAGKAMTTMLNPSLRKRDSALSHTSLSDLVEFTVMEPRLRLLSLGVPTPLNELSPTIAGDLGGFPMSVSHDSKQDTILRSCLVSSLDQDFPSANIKNNSIHLCCDRFSSPDSSVSVIANSTSVRSVLERVTKRFQDLYQKKAFLHWFTGEGFDEMEFHEAGDNVQELISEYEERKNGDISEDASDEDETQLLWYSFRKDPPWIKEGV